MKPRIIAFMNSYSHGKSGGDMVFIEIAKRLKGWNKMIITSQLGSELCKTNGVDGKFIITTSEAKFKHVIWIYLKRIIIVLGKRLNLRKGDVLLGTSDFLPDVLPILLKKSRKKNKWIQHVFHLISKERPIPFITQAISLFFIKLFADLIIVDNQLLKNQLVVKGFHPNKIVVNYPGINLTDLRNTKKNLNSNYDGIFMAQLRASKGIFDLIKIWKLVCKKKPEAMLGIIGKGEDEVTRQLLSRVKNLGLEKNIKLLGFLPNKEAFSIIKSSKVFLFPSHEEGFGIAALEAQALGIPVVAWNLPVFSEVFPKGMMKISLSRFDKFALSVIELLSSKSRSDKLSRDAVLNARRFNWDNTAKRERMLIQ